MSSCPLGDGQRQQTGQGVRLLERITAGILVLVILALVWMVMVAFQPVWARWASEEVEVVGMLVLLAAALTLVSVLALQHTR
jgi:hypothetical protein